ncbi:unnamed protein product [Symbiodinium natans]|uniref:Uncharacterized protein n=1 Tax=Symbiodinium natans TaxID=878477 RepID=A0A812IEE4_9DINO|nr:unnamed protein product [Symbiodinium natans]
MQIVSSCSQVRQTSSPLVMMHSSRQPLASVQEAEVGYFEPEEPRVQCGMGLRCSVDGQVAENRQAGVHPPHAQEQGGSPQQLIACATQVRALDSAKQWYSNTNDLCFEAGGVHFHGGFAGSSCNCTVTGLGQIERRASAPALLHGSGQTASPAKLVSIT